MRELVVGLNVLPSEHQPSITRTKHTSHQSNVAVTGPHMPSGQNVLLHTAVILTRQRCTLAADSSTRLWYSINLNNRRDGHGDSETPSPQDRYPETGTPSDSLTCPRYRHVPSSGQCMSHQSHPYKPFLRNATNKLHDCRLPSRTLASGTKSMPQTVSLVNWQNVLL
jgi:hypothetical protein